MEKNKAAGPDGLPIELYQDCWEVIKDDLIALFGDFHQGELHTIELILELLL
jgi:mannosylglycoprotein endo-beta-mannosidase